MSTQTKILVLGAGELGLAILQALAAHPSASHTHLHVLLRPQSHPPSPSKAAQLSTIHDLGITIVEGELATASLETLTLLFTPYHTIISCTGFIAGPGTQLRLCAAALAARTPRYFPWQFGVDYDVLGRGSAQDLFDEQLDVRELLRAQTATEWVIVSTGMFMSFLFEEWWGVVDFKGGRVTALGGWANSVAVTAVEDIGRLVAELVHVEPRVRNRVVFTAGEDVSYGRLADVVEKLLGEVVKREVWTVQRLEDELKAEPEDALKKYRVVFAKGKGVSWDLEKTFNKQQGIQIVDVEKWLRLNLKRLTQHKSI